MAQGERNQDYSFTTGTKASEDKAKLLPETKNQKEAAERNHIEGKFGQGKNGYNLNEIRARLRNTSESWVACIFFVMNLVHYQANYFFDYFLRWIYCEPQRILVRNVNVMPVLELKLTTRNKIWEIRYW